MRSRKVLLPLSICYLKRSGYTFRYSFFE
uniref:Uncharacterized protein n=1 Tax=Anguilla anguilla TaxID=7936 RepID=A0A0E9TEV5_ANGAN